MKVLLLEDDSAVGGVLLQCLKIWDHDVVLSQNADTAWAALQQAPFDMLITDWALPGTTGTEFVRRLRHEHRFSQMPVLMISGRTEKSDIVEAIRAGVNDFLPKPFTPKQLLAKLQLLTRLFRETLNPERLTRLLDGQVAETRACESLLVIGEPADSVEALLRPDRQAIADYLLRLTSAVQRCENAEGKGSLGYIICSNTHDVADLLQKSASRQRTRLVLVSPACVGNSFSLVRSLASSPSRNYAVGFIYDTNTPISGEDQATLERLGAQVFKRAQLDAKAIQALLHKHMSASPE